MNKLKYLSLSLLCFGMVFSTFVFGQDEQAVKIIVKSPDEIYLGAVMEQGTINAENHDILDIINDTIVMSFQGLTAKSKAIKSNKEALYQTLEDIQKTEGVSVPGNGEFSFNVRELGSYNSLSIFFGQKLNLASWFSVDESINTVKPKTLLAINMEKIVFTIYMDLPTSGVFNTNKDLQDKYNINDLIYVNSLSFGRKAVVVVESNLEASQVKSALSVILNGNQLSDNDRGVLANCSYRIAILGGKDTINLNDSSQPLQQVIDYMEMETDLNNYKPIAFGASYLKTHILFSNSY